MSEEGISGMRRERVATRLYLPDRRRAPDSRRDAQEVVACDVFKVELLFLRAFCAAGALNKALEIKNTLDYLEGLYFFAWQLILDTYA